MSSYIYQYRRLCILAWITPRANNLQGERIKKLINFGRLRPRRDQEC